MKGFYIPCQDSLFHRQLITQLSGKEAGNSRKKVMHNRNNTKCPQLDVSLWLPPHDEDETYGIVSVTSISSLIAETLMSNHQHAGIKCTVTELGDVYTHPTSGRKAQTYRITYGVSSSLVDSNINGEEGDKEDTNMNGVLSFEDAKRLHVQICESIPITFTGAECR